MAEEETSAEALVSLRGIGSQSPFSSPVRRNTPPRSKKRTRQTDDSLEEADQDRGTDEGEYTLSSPRTRRMAKAASVLPVTGNGSTDKRIAKASFAKLQNLLKLPKAARWCYFEWFYSSLDRVLFEGDNDFHVCLKESFPNLKTRKLRRIEWREVRRLMGKPRRCSPAFFLEERQALEEKRRKIRMLQQRKWTHFFHLNRSLNLAGFKDLPDEVPLPLVIGTKVTARLRDPQDGLFTGQIDAVDTANYSYRVTFDRPGLGTHSVPDLEVLSEEPNDTMPISSFLQKERPRTAAFSPAYTPPRLLPAGGDVNSPNMVHDPLIGASPGRLRLQDAISQQGQGGTLGGFPIRFLILVTRLSKILLVKKECIEKLRDMNTQAEKMKSYQEPIDKEFQRRYASVVLELERLNKDLNEYLTGVQEYCQELAPEQGVQSMDQSTSVKRRCDEEATRVVEENNTSMGLNAITSQPLVHIVSSLTSLMLQIKSLAENDLNTFEFKSLSDAVDEIKKSIDPSNISCFQNNVEIHVAHIQSGLSQMGNLHAFSSSSGSS
ncbi:Protein lin-9 [Desmophyllum pertusum]|uniref:Protein lin-9 n=1 Tax=Desmophyllum pertusum TaxID=174260 RepID=A0A9W9Z1W0_9CNID|nr:Protein lin-9 [Desmophyllum pertusum]